MNKIDQYLNYYILLLVNERTTKGLFQATVFLAGLFLIGAKDQGAFLYQQEVSAYEIKFQVEESNNKKPLNEIKCEQLKVGYSACNLAKYKMETVHNYTNAFISVMDLIRFFFIICGTGCLASFILRPIISEKTNA